MAVKIVSFFDGFTSETNPAAVNVWNQLVDLVDDAAYVTYKGSAATEGDIYSNTTDNTIHWHDGTAWRSVATSITVSDHNDVTTAHGATGAVVGTTNTQILSNKTISDNLPVKGQAYSEHQTTLTPTGTTETVDWDDGNSVTIDLGSATGDVTLTLSNPVSGASYALEIIQGATARDITWPAAVKWQGGVAPVISTTDDAIDMITLIYIGSSYLGNFGQDYQ